MIYYDQFIFQTVRRVKDLVKGGLLLEEAISKIAQELKIPTTHIVFENARNQFKT